MATDTFSSNFALTNNYFYLTRRDTIGSVTIESTGRWDGTTSP